MKNLSPAVRNLSLGILLLFFSIFIFLAVIPAISETGKAKALRVSCKSNLKEISLAIMAYEVDNKACPSNLEVLVLTGYLGRKSLTCPLARVKIVGFSIQDFRYFNHYAKNTGVSDYLYFKPLYSTTIDGKSEKNILCLDCLKNHQGATDDVNVLYNDGALGANGTKTVHGTISTLKIKDLPPEIIKQIQYSAQPPTDPLN